eukprot:15478246-Alexandrium_andersonii.AAC.1
MPASTRTTHSHNRHLLPKHTTGEWGPGPTLVQGATATQPLQQLSGPAPSGTTGQGGAASVGAGGPVLGDPLRTPDPHSASSI